MKKIFAAALLLAAGAAQAAGTYVVLCKTVDTSAPSCQVSQTSKALLFTDFAAAAKAIGCSDIGNYAYDCRTTTGDFANAIVRGMPPVFPFETELKSVYILQ